MTVLVALLTVVADSPMVQSATAASPHGTANGVMVKNPVPGFVGRMFQYIFNTPTWVQWSGIIIGAIIGVVLLRWAYTHRIVIRQWLSTRSRAYKTGLASVAAVMVMGAGGVGYAGNHYMEHNNDFCIGCHVMGNAWGAFQKSEHRKLECHDCHRQSKFASARQLYFWIAEKPTEIPVHAKVPTAVCAECHVRSDADSAWKRIVSTAGHRLHLKSDSSALKNVACVTCHGTEVHQFKSVDKTCGQSGCHSTDATKVRLGKMAGQTSQHCTGCHTFSRAVPDNISMDSTRKFLVANGSPTSCFGCHEMKLKLKGFTPEEDRGHKAVCGTCHDPHKQTEPRQAYESCATNGCHSDLKTKSTFHAGLKAHTNAPCGQCHTPHDWKPIATTCEGCHKTDPGGRVTSPPRIKMPETHSVRPTSDRGRRTSAVRLASHARARTTVLSRQVMWRPSARLQPPVSGGVAAPQPARTVAKPKETSDFSHQKHKLLACAGCHDQKNAPGAIKIRSRTDCATCHHAADRSVSCEGCHSARSAKMNSPFPRTVSVRVAGSTSPVTRTLPFVHREHRDLECKGCHTEGVLLGVKRDCQSCHESHHTPERTCLTCHQPPKAAHTRAAHDGCAGSGCHSNSAVLALPPSRSTCLACHAEQVKHKPKRECAECHAVTWGRTANSPH